MVTSYFEQSNSCKMAIVSLDDMNWNALEWDRAAEELTWERVSKNNFLEFNNSGSYLK